MSNSFVTPWNVAHQAPLFMEFSRWEYWSEFPFSSPGELSANLNRKLQNILQLLFAMEKNNLQYKILNNMWKIVIVLDFQAALTKYYKLSGLNNRNVLSHTIHGASLVAQSVKNICLQHGRPGFDPWVGKIPCRRSWQDTLVFLPKDSHEQRSLASSVHGVAELDIIEWLTLLLSLFHSPKG